MIPVDQTEFGRPHGNCFSAALASLLELPIEAVPNFNRLINEGAGDGGWTNMIQTWLAPRGFFLLTIDAGPVSRESLLPIPQPGYCIVSGQARREEELIPHSVVGQLCGSTIKMIHDPNARYRTGLEVVEQLEFLVPLDPVRLAAQQPQGENRDAG